MTENQYARWEAAVYDGKPLDLGERGDPPSGYYRFAPWKTDAEKKQTTVALWRAEPTVAGEPGAIYVERNFHTPKTMTAMEADDLFQSQHVAISYDLYESRRTKAWGDPWPEIHTTYLRTKDIKAGVVWTEEWSRRLLAGNVETHDEAGNPRAVIGGNNPPPDAPPETPLSAAEQLAARIKSVGLLVADVLKGFGGKPRSKTEADTVADYAVKFKALENEAVAAHKIEKAPHLAAGQAVDDKWRTPREAAVASRAKVLKLASDWIDADRDARQAEADKVNAAAKAAAKKQEAQTGAPAEPVEEVKVESAKLGTGKTVSQRANDTWRVNDYAEFVVYLIEKDAMPPYLTEAFDKCATFLGKAEIRAPGIEKITVRKAA